MADNLVLNQYYVAPFATAPTWRQLPLALAAYALLFSAVFLAGVWVWSGSVRPTLQSVLKLADPEYRFQMAEATMAAGRKFFDYAKARDQFFNALRSGQRKQ